MPPVPIDISIKPISVTVLQHLGFRNFESFPVSIFVFVSFYLAGRCNGGIAPTAKVILPIAYTIDKYKIVLGMSQNYKFQIKVNKSLIFT